MHRLVLAFAAITLLSAALAWGQGLVAEPYARLFASPSGRIGLKVLPNGNDATRPATAIAFTLAPDGTEQLLWRRELLNVPGDVSLFEDGGQVYVVTLDRWGSAGGEHAFVVYGPKGQVLRDLRPEALRSAAPAAAPAPPAAGGTPPSARALIQARSGGSWRTGSTLHLVTGDGATRLELRWADGAAATIPLPTGPLKPANLAH